MFEFLKHLLRLARPYRARLALGVLFGVLAGLAEPLMVVLIPVVGRVVFPSADMHDVPDFSKNIPRLVKPLLAPLLYWLEQPGVAKTDIAKILVISVIPVVVLLRGVFTYLNVYLMSWVGVRTVSDLRTRLFAHLQTLSLSFFSHSNTGELISRITSDTLSLQNTLRVSIPVMINDPVTLISLATVLLTLHPKLTLITLLVFPILVLPAAIYNKKIRRSGSAIQANYAELANVMHEAFTGNRIIKAYNLEQTMVERFTNTCRKYVGHFMRTVRSAETPGPLIEFTGSIGVACMFYIFAVRMGASPERFIQFVITIFLMYKPLKNVIRLSNNLTLAKASSERVFQMLALQPTVVEPQQPKPLRAAGADIRFENVSFFYDEKPVLRSFNLTIKAGQMCALVGRTGSGKTTITNLLLRFYDPQKGSVKIGDTDVREVGLKELRSQIAMVSQDTILFNDTIFNNIALGKPGATDEEIYEAARRAHVQEFIAQKEGGYNFLIGEKGGLLSGGQKQRLSIARALLRDAPILVLDEATSALDSEVERALQAELEELTKGRTTICIAHRLSTIQKADVIIVLHEGQIVEQGTHSDLLQRDGYYKRLYELQFQQ